MYDLLDKVEVCRLFGGTRPIHPATLYRAIRAGRYPRPKKSAAPLAGSVRNARLSCRGWLRRGRQRPVSKQEKDEYLSQAMYLIEGPRHDGLNSKWLVRAPETEKY